MGGFKYIKEKWGGNVFSGKQEMDFNMEMSVAHTGVYPAFALCVIFSQASWQQIAQNTKWVLSSCIAHFVIFGSGTLLAIFGLYIVFSDWGSTLPEIVYGRGVNAE